MQCFRWCFFYVTIFCYVSLKVMSCFLLWYIIGYACFRSVFCDVIKLCYFFFDYVMFSLYSLFWLCCFFVVYYVYDYVMVELMLFLCSVTFRLWYLFMLCYFLVLLFVGYFIFWLCDFLQLCYLFKLFCVTFFFD